MTGSLIGYARYATDKQELKAQRPALVELGAAADRIYTDHGLTGCTRGRSGLDQALAAMREGDDRLWMSGFTYVATWQGFVYVVFLRCTRPSTHMRGGS